MKLGILSDSHGQARRTREAMRLLADSGADVVVHLGDVETESVLDELAGYPVRLVFGNCDWNTESLALYASALGIQVDHPIGMFRENGRSIAFTHGDRDALMKTALADEVDFLLHGHSHQIRDEKNGRTRIINPGALHRASRYTVATLEPGKGVLRFLELPRNC